MRSVDVLALVLGVVLSAVAGLVLWASLFGSINWEVVRIAAPLGLVSLGVVGLALSRHRS
jgi:cytochrome b subunit of formate dehydrogenase